jgi:hypothetical protein
VLLRELIWLPTFWLGAVMVERDMVEFEVVGAEEATWICTRVAADGQRLPARKNARERLAAAVRRWVACAPRPARRVFLRAHTRVVNC